MTSPRRAVTLAVLLGLSAALPGAGVAAAPTPTPYESVRSLRRLQEQVAHGSAAALAAQGRLLASLGPQFIEADPAVWRDPRNARAAVIYLFSGGKPAVVRTVLSRATMPREIDRLLKGALSYAEGQDQVARDLLDPIDPRALPPAVGGHLALVEATLRAREDPAKASRLLDLARLLVPGSLIEEAALRRQVALQSDTDGLPRFVSLSRQYLRRFKTSIYARNFKQQFAAVAIKLGAGGDVALLGRLDPVMAELPPDEQRGLYLAVAKAAVVQGQVGAARYAAGRAATIAKDAAHDDARAKLYLDAASILTEDPAKGIAALEAADRDRLSPADAELRDAALAVARSVTAPVPEAGGGAPVAASPGDPDIGATVRQAQDMLAASSQLLGATP